MAGRLSISSDEWNTIPEQLRGVYKCAQRVSDKAGKVAGAHHYGDIFTSPITAGRLKKWLAKKKKNTAPGVTGVRVDHLAAAPPRARRAWAKMLSMPYVAGCMYTDWGEEIVNWIPKVEGDSDLKKRRPLMYYEVMRKMAIGIKKSQVLKVWKSNGWIDEDNYTHFKQE